MPITKLQKNWDAVSFASAPITRVTNVSFNVNGQNQGFAGDNDLFNSAMVNMLTEVTATVDSGDTGTIMAIAPGTEGDFTATHLDAAGETGGNVVYVLANAVVSGPSTSGAHGAYGTAQLQLTSYSPDGQTNPLSFTRT